MIVWIRKWSIAARLFALQFVFVVALTAASVAWLWVDTSGAQYDQAASTSMTVAASVAANPFVHSALATVNPSSLLEPYAVATVKATSTDFITIMKLDRTRYTHPNPAEIGKPFIGTIAPALAGRSFTETYTGTLGPSVRAVVPIRDDSGTIIALVSAGVEVRNINAALWPRLPVVIFAGAATMLLGAVASWLLSRYLRRVTWGRGPVEMSRMFAYYEGVLNSVHEGLVLVDRERRVVLYNDHAAELLGLPTHDGPSNPTPLADLDIAGDVKELLASGAHVADAVYSTDDRILIINQEVAISNIVGYPARAMGTVASLRDHTELRRLSGELQTMRTLSDALRSQSHEFANRLHTIISLIELGHPRDALKFASHQLDAGQQLVDQLAGTIDEPALAALLLGKSAHALERGIQLQIDIPAELGELGIDPVDIVTIIGNLVDNAMDAASLTDHEDAAGRSVAVTVHRTPTGELRIRVADNGPGVADSRLAFEQGFSTKESGSMGRGFGLALVRQSVQRLGGAITVANEGGAVFTVTLPAPRDVEKGA
jgi:sensor histidine kinase regulating citrate/malate metabolism